MSNINEKQFINALASNLRSSLNNWEIESNKEIGQRQVDMFMKNKDTGKSYAVEVRGNARKGFLPPEIISGMRRLKTEINDKNNQIIILSLSDVEAATKQIFENNGFNVFESNEDMANIADKFKIYIGNLNIGDKEQNK
jgi:hypothetical protein